MDDDTDGSNAPVRTVGQRIQYLRERRGMTQEVLAGLVGKSTSWLKQVENGRLQQNPRLPIILQLAEALRIRDLIGVDGRPVHAGANVHRPRTPGARRRYLRPR